MTRLLHKLRRFGARIGSEGGAAVEYGVILPLLLTMMLGVVDMGRLLWTYTTLARATEAAARCAAVNATTCGSASNIQTYAAAQAFGLSVTSSAFAVSYPNCGVQVNASYTFQFLMPWLFGAPTSSVALSTQACFLPQTG